MDSVVSYGDGVKQSGIACSEGLDELLNVKECYYSPFSVNQKQFKTPMNATLPYRRSSPTNQVSNDRRGEKSENTDEMDTHKEMTKERVNRSCHLEIDSSDKVKTKLMSMWNNMKYGWTVKVKTNFSYESPIWLLGKCYHKKLQGEEFSPENSDFATRNLSMELFKQDFFSRIWFTYRREFPSLAGSSLTTDCGWGCMLRSGQMLLAQALICHFIYRDWQWSRLQTSKNEVYHRTILRWFGDHPCASSPFSVHQLVALGESSGKKAGDWYGPASVAHILRQAIEMAAKQIPLLDSLCVYVAQDCTIYQQDIFDLCSRPPQRHSFSENECRAYGCCDAAYTQNGSSSTEGNMKYVKNEQWRQVQPDAAGPSEINKADPKCFSSWEDCQQMYNYQNNAIKPKTIAVNSSGLELQEFDCNFEANHFADPCFYSESIEKAVDCSYVPDGKSKLEEISFRNFSHETYSKNDKSENFVTCIDNVNYPFHPPRLITGSCDQNSKAHCDKMRRNSRYSLARSSSVPSPPTEEASYFPEDFESNVKEYSQISSEGHEHSKWRRGVVILVPVRLGGDVLNRSYIPRVRHLLTQEHCIGIIGGRPRHSLYFVGWQDDKFIYLDPHYCQETVDVCTSDFPLQSFHCSVPRKMLCTKMDPSCTIGFYCKRRNDFLEFVRTTKQILSPYKQKGDYPIFTIQEGKREDATTKIDAITKEQQLAQSLNYSWIQDDELETIEIDGEDFVVI